MDVIVTDVRERKRYEARVGDELAAVAEYIPTDEFLAFTHTEVFGGFEGQGVASTLVRGALDDVRAQHRAVLPVCPFVTGFIRRHRAEYADLLYRSRTKAIHD
jgi:predicted GNAT family acetyltransferase